MAMADFQVAVGYSVDDRTQRLHSIEAMLNRVLSQSPNNTTGGKPKLLGISKRGNKYLRRQLIHGTRAVLCPMWLSATRRSAVGRKS